MKSTTSCHQIEENFSESDSTYLISYSKTITKREGLQYANRFFFFFFHLQIKIQKIQIANSSLTSCNSRI